MYEQIMELIKQLASDMSRTSQEILEDLQGIRDETEMLIEATKTDIENQDEIK